VSTVAVAIFCKTPAAGLSKSRLSPPLRPEECEELSACFIRDLAATVHALGGVVVPYAAYTPVGSEPALRALLPSSFRLLPQCRSDFGTRAHRAASDLLHAGHAGAILVNADSPTLPPAILGAAVDALRRSGDRIVLSPALDGGYTLIGLRRPHARIFADIPWSTSRVHGVTLERAREIGVPVVEVPGWYDVDDAGTLDMLEAELAGERSRFATPGIVAAPAFATRRFLQRRRSAAGEGLSR
jgi:hypothetical protein